MRVAVVTSCWPPFQSGVSVSAWERAAALRALGHDVLAIVPSCYGAAEGPPGVALASFPAFHIERRRSSVTWPIAGVVAIRRALARFGAEVAWIEEPEHVFFGTILPWRAIGTPAAGMLHTDYEGFNLQTFPWPRAVRAWVGHMYGRARGMPLVTHCGTLRDRAVAHGLAAPEVGPYHGVAERFFAGAPPPLAARPRDVVFVGALREEKGVLTLARILGAAQALRPGLTATIVGDGADRGRLALALARAGGRADLTGFLPPAALPDVLDEHRVFLNASEHEAFCTSNLEAMARKLVVLGVDSGGQREQVFPGRTGLRFSRGGIEEAAEKLLAVCARPDVYQPLADGARIWVEPYRWSRVATATLATLRRLRPGSGLP